MFSPYLLCGSLSCPESRAQSAGPRSLVPGPSVCALSFSRCWAVSKLENRAAGKYGKMQMSMGKRAKRIGGRSHHTALSRLHDF